MFVDGDDALHPLTLERIAQMIAKDAQAMIIYGIKHIDENYFKSYLQEVQEQLPLQASYAYGKLNAGTLFRMYGGIGGKVFRCDIIEKNKLAFSTEIKIFEDFPYVLQYLYYTETCFFNQEGLYYYQFRSSSRSHGKFEQARPLTDYTDIIESNLPLMRDSQKLKGLKRFHFQLGLYLVIFYHSRLLI